MEDKFAQICLPTPFALLAATRASGGMLVTDTDTDAEADAHTDG